MEVIKVHVLLITFCVFVGFHHASVTKHRKRRYLFNNPADMSTMIGYQNHEVPDMTSLVNEASTHAHGGTANQGQNANNRPYNIPNFPAMSGSIGGTGTGNTATGTASGSASFAGTNQWRCDSHVVRSCDIQCLDVDPKDGCPFCIPTCSRKAGTLSGTQTNSQSGNQPFSGTSGTAALGSQSSGMSQHPGSFTGKGLVGQSGSSACPFYPQNCPKIYTKLEKGCLVCTILPKQTSTASAKSTLPPTTQKTTAVTCAPKRCVPPCDKGVVLGADGCPRCLCPAHV